MALYVYASGQESQSAPEVAKMSITETFSIYYKVDSIDINPTYLENRKNIAHILDYLENSPRIDSITIYAWASPEGCICHQGHSGLDVEEEYRCRPELFPFWILE